MKNLKYYLNKAYREKFAIGQFNFSDWSQVKGIVSAAEAMKSPIILGTSEGESKFVGLAEAVAMRDALRKKTGLPIFLNLDHGKSFEYLKKAMLAGYNMVHFDGSKLSLEDLPASATQKALQAGNISISKKVVQYAHWRGVVVEGEVGRFGTDASKLYTEKFQIKEEDLTNPDDAKKYLSEAKVNLLAVSIGTFHGLDVTGISPNIRIDRLRELREALRHPSASLRTWAQGKTKPIGFVLHGGSGTPENDIREAIKLGIIKININTETRLAFTNTLRNSLEANKEEITPYKYLQNSVNAVQKVIEEKIKLFGSENKA